jgi:predicted O-linked N-acetylglucosamine transferase (SPINDLY family)
MGSANATVSLQQAHAHHRAGRLAEAEALYARVRSLAPRSFDAYHLSGFLALQQRRFEDASPLLKRACELNPRSASAWLRWASALKALGQTAEACKAAENATQCDPKNADAHFMLGELAAATGGFARAVPHFRRVAELQPEAADGWANLGVALTQSGGNAEACSCFERALGIDPANGQALTGRALALQQSHRVEEASVAFAAAIEKQPSNFQARSGRLLTLQYRADVTREALFAEHRAFAESVIHYMTLSSQPQSAVAGGRGVFREGVRRLRVAFLSPDFRGHSVAYFIQPLLAHLDPAQFEIFLYHDHPIVDATSAQLRAYATTWRHFAGWPDARVEAAIRDDAPDVLVDLAGHTGFNRLPLFARRLAPVQISYLGYPDTTGLAEMDYRFTDEIADPVGEADAFHSERLVRFAPTAWAYAPPPDAPEPTRLSAETFTFGCFNNFSKVSDATLRLWSGVLAAVPGSRLLLKSQGLDEPEIQQRCRERLIAHDIDPARVELVGRIAGCASHLSFYGRVDVALDTFPYHGTTTTCEALWMGVPVVTLAGDAHRARVGMSLLNAIGRPEWVAHSEDEYVRIAAGLAAIGVRTGEAGEQLRAIVSASALLEHGGQAKRFGQALQCCWDAVRDAAV